MRKLQYCTKTYPFEPIITNHLNFGKLEELNLENKLFTRETDQKTEAHRRFYSIGEEFYSVYRRLINMFIRPLFGEQFLYQKIPTFRVAFPNNVAVGEFHRDRDYGHSKEEINFFVPITRAFDTNTIWVESAEGFEDYLPQNAEYGEILMFDGANLKHGNRINKTGRTRVSFDFRVIHASKHVPSERKTINTKIPFTIGGYWTQL